MVSVSTQELVDFVLTSGTGRITQVKQMKVGVHVTDFYRPVREAIADMHRSGLAESVLDDMLSSLMDPRERRIFPKVVNGYKKFLRSGKATWFEPPMRDYSLGPVSVSVVPEIGLLIDGRPHVIKLYFRGDPLSPQRILVTNQLLTNALSTTWPGTVFATLDVRRARLYPYRPKSEVGLLLKAEAQCLASLHANL